MSRKTFNIDELKTMVNDMCRFSLDDKRGVRQGAMNVLEEVLHRSGNYRGFRYLSQYDMEAGLSVGIFLQPDHTHTETCFEMTDNTRVCYY